MKECRLWEDAFIMKMNVEFMKTIPW